MKRLVLLGLLIVTSLQTVSAQINNIDDFIDKVQELRVISQKMGKYYILQNLYPSKEKYKKDAQANIDEFNNSLVELIEQAPSDELQMELQKLNLTWMYVGKILKTKYDRAAAAKVLDKLEYLQKEADNISQLAMQLTKKNLAEVIYRAAEARVMLQRLNLYYIANRAKILNKHIKDRFNESLTKVRENLTFLENSPVNDDTINMLLGMIRDRLKSFGKKITLKSKVNPLTADMITENMDEDFKLLIKTYKEKLSQ